MRQAAVAVVVLALLGTTAGCSALRQAIGGGECQDRVVRKIETNYPEAQWARIDSDSVQEREAGNGDVRTVGRGQIKTRKGDLRAFTFSCFYDKSRGELTKVTYDLGSGK